MLQVQTINVQTSAHVTTSMKNKEKKGAHVQ